MRDRDEIEDQIHRLEGEILEKKGHLSELRRQLPLKKVRDYELKTSEGQTILLSEIFGSHRDLVMVQNMGSFCPYCTLWADGFQGSLKAISERATFCLLSPEEPIKLKAFAESRGWEFPVYSCYGSMLKKDLGFETADGQQIPGVVTFHKDLAGDLFLAHSAPFGPFDDFSSVWHFFDLLKEGVGNWQPHI